MISLLEVNFALQKLGLERKPQIIRLNREPYDFNWAGSGEIGPLAASTASCRTNLSASPTASTSA